MSDELKTKNSIKGVKVVCYKQSNNNIMCKINMMPFDAKSLCKRTKSGLYINKELQASLINMIVTELEKLDNE